MTSENYEELYNKLKEDFEQNLKDNEEICKEYETTIQMLTDSAETLKMQKEELEQKLSKIESDQKSFKKEKESLISKSQFLKILI